MFQKFRIKTFFWKLMTSGWENWVFKKFTCIIVLSDFSQFFNLGFLAQWYSVGLQILRSWAQTPLGENLNYHFHFLCFFWTKIGIFYALMHKERHKRSLFYFLKIYNNCSFSFSSKMKFPISQLDVVEMNNWEHVLNGCEKTITELPSNVSEHFF